MSADNFIAYIGIIVQWRYPNAKLWQQRIILNAGARGLTNLTYDEAQSEFRRITFAILNLIKASRRQVIHMRGIRGLYGVSR